MKDKSNSDEKAAREHGQQHRIVWRNSRRGAKGVWFNPQAESSFEKAVWEWQWLEQDLFMKISLLEFFFIGRLYLQSFSIGRCLHSSHSGYMGVGIWHRWSTGEKLAPRRYHLLSIICESHAIFVPTTKGQLNLQCGDHTIAYILVCSGHKNSVRFTINWQ